MAAAGEAGARRDAGAAPVRPGGVRARRRSGDGRSWRTPGARTTAAGRVASPIRRATICCARGCPTGRGPPPVSGRSVGDDRRPGASLERGLHRVRAGDDGPAADLLEVPDAGLDLGLHAARREVRALRERAFASLMVSRSTQRCSGRPQSSATCGTDVLIMNTSARSSMASRAEAKSLSMTAATPWRSPCSSATTGMPPPPTVMATKSSRSSARTASSSTIRSGRGDGTTRRQPRPASSRTAQPSASRASRPRSRRP